jgi:hypothetical protein
MRAVIVIVAGIGLAVGVASLTGNFQKPGPADRLGTVGAWIVVNR